MYEYIYYLRTIKPSNLLNKKWYLIELKEINNITKSFEFVVGFFCHFTKLHLYNTVTLLHKSSFLRFKT